ncbi:hypothetical protein SAMN05216320_112124 [Duganella sp. OV458]|nr:hypothetical protein SAMN05216320_112124 [Duganella sp. OV458]SDK51995.1 hypothetical protein SAMN05428973_112124 [Duganella sp. OV510]
MRCICPLCHNIKKQVFSNDQRRGYKPKYLNTVIFLHFALKFEKKKQLPIEFALSSPLFYCIFYHSAIESS